MKFTEPLRKNYQFRFVYNKGHSRANRLLVMYVQKNGTDRNRLGICVSKKVGKSVVRSRVTRLIRESYRLNEHNIGQGYDIVVIARAACAGSLYAQVESAQLHLIRKHNLHRG
ncbi:MAG: ribonuclease P protein component [Defluviitaleaceae bacterium]|nr:ribonuclease P protein component [Defluviitaleaceae bacterium]